MIKVISREFAIVFDAGEITDDAGGRWAKIARDVIDDAERSGRLSRNPIDPDPDLSRAEIVAEYFGARLDVPADRKIEQPPAGAVY